MHNCMIGALISTVTLDFTCIHSVRRFSLCELSYVSRIKIFEALWIKEDSKRGFETPNTEVPWPVPRFMSI